MGKGDGVFSRYGGSTTERADVSVGSGVSVGTGVGVSVGSGVSVGTGVGVSVGSGVSVGMGVGVFVGSGVSVGMGVGVQVLAGNCSLGFLVAVTCCTGDCLMKTSTSSMAVPAFSKVILTNLARRG